MTLFRPLGIDIFCQGKKFLTYNLVSRNLKIKYRRSFFGFFWSLLVPLGTASVYFVVFKLIIKIAVPHYLVFILSGVLPWTFFSLTVIEGMDSIVGNANILNKVPVPLQVFPFVGALTNYTTLFLSLPVLLGAMLFTHNDFGWATLMAIPYLLLLFFIAYAFSIILALAFVYFRDLRHAFGIIIQLWFYGTPVLYREEMIPDQWRFLLALNPIGYIFTGLHRTLVYAEVPSLPEVAFPLLWALFLFLGSLLALRRFSKGTVEIL